tara:strand:+ start:553 stop:768 length:216 start_codon:yes stop_codon:yes gene_type:complete
LDEINATLKEFGDAFNRFIEIQMETNIKMLGMVLESSDLDGTIATKILDAITNNNEDEEGHWEEFPCNNEE